MIQKLLHCIRCHQLIPRFGDFGDFSASPSIPGVEWSPEDLQIQAEFFSQHHRHSIEELFPDLETLISDKPYVEPMKISYFEASNGKKKFLIKRTKNHLTRPAFYKLIPGRLKINIFSIKIQEVEICRELLAYDASQNLSKEKISKFIHALKGEVEKVTPENWDTQMQIIPDPEMPLSADGFLREEQWEKVFSCCQKDLPPEDIAKIKNFIFENGQSEKVLALRIQRKISILPPRKEEDFNRPIQGLSPKI